MKITHFAPVLLAASLLITVVGNSSLMSADPANQSQQIAQNTASTQTLRSGSFVTVE